ncbi:MAG: phosphatase PAP2 family protein [Bacteroidales bacterium]
MISKRETPYFVQRGIIILIAIFLTIGLHGQNSRFKPVDYSDSVYRFSVKKVIIPSVLVGYGFAGLMIDPIKNLNLKIRSEITSRVTTHRHIDNFTQYAPAGAVYGLNLLGIKGKHNFLDRSIILGTSLAVMGISVTGIKQLTHIQRPDGTSYNSFPSGHTATAFACAEFLYQEYKDVSVWYGIAGYTIAAGTGFMRMYNNRHWLTDVVAGAGFGILSTKIAYWVFPKIKKLFFKDIQISFSLVPSFDPRYGPVR